MSTDERKRRQPRARPPLPERDVTEPHDYAYLSEWRVLKGKTLDDVATALGVSAPTVHRWETGDTPITVKTWFRLAELYEAQHPSELLWPPNQKEKIAALRSAHAILMAMSPKDLDHWIALGRRIAELTPDEATEEPAPKPAPRVPNPNKHNSYDNNHNTYEERVGRSGAVIGNADMRGG